MILRPSRSCTISSLSSSSTRAVPTHRIHVLAAPQPDSSSRRQASIAVRLHGSIFLQRHKLQAARHARRQCNLCCASQRTTQRSEARGLSGSAPGGGTSSIAVARAPTCAGLRWSPAQQCTHGPAPQPAGGRKLHTVPDENLARADPPDALSAAPSSYKNQLLRILSGTLRQVRSIHTVTYGKRVYGVCCCSQARRACRALIFLIPLQDEERVSVPERPAVCCVGVRRGQAPVVLP